MAHKIAIASSDGNYIDMHFAQAYQYYIYEVEDKNYIFLEVRKIEVGNGHDENEFARILDCLKDCAALVVSRVGIGAAKYIAQSGKKIFEAPYSIKTVLEKFVVKQILKQNDK
ncbi:MAG: Dinitrogenase iron-molybdenum cofactor biosynthesis protein [Firmicutes bacterium]|nr:Dinitrogenase iron-molybdenum cofactor biosynthesis protein [Bacillota bacterium]